MVNTAHRSSIVRRRRQIWASERKSPWPWGPRFLSEDEPWDIRDAYRKSLGEGASQGTHSEGSSGLPNRRLLTDNGSCYRSRAFRQACRRLGIRQRFTRPYTPRTNGKAERFIQTALRKWAYARSYQSSQ